MGFLVRADGAGNMSKCTISMWFRLPSASAAAVQSRDGPSVFASESPQVMDNVVPLLMFGSQQTETIYDITNVDASCPSNAGDIPRTISYISGSHSAPMQQSCLGVQCYGTGDPANNFFVHIQPDHGVSMPTGALTLDDGPSWTCPALPAGGAPITSQVDVSYMYNGMEGTAVGNANNVANIQPISTPTQAFAPVGGLPAVSLDVWHHVLISWDLHDESCVAQTESTVGQPAADRITTSSKMYFAFDNVNKNGMDLPATWVGRDGLGSPDPNLICCGMIYGWANGAVSFVWPDATPGPGLSFSYGTIPSAPFWIAGSDSIATASRGTIVGNEIVEMSRPLQIYPGVLLDTSIEANRRLFITADNKPQLSTVASDVLGTPAVLFNSTKKFQNGTNSGTAGNFEHTGTINPYSPGP